MRYLDPVDPNSSALQELGLKSAVDEWPRFSHIDPNSGNRCDLIYFMPTGRDL